MNKWIPDKTVFFTTEMSACCEIPYALTCNYGLPGFCIFCSYVQRSLCISSVLPNENTKNVYLNDQGQYSTEKNKSFGRYKPFLGFCINSLYRSLTVTLKNAVFYRKWWQKHGHEPLNSIAFGILKTIGLCYGSISWPCDLHIYYSLLLSLWILTFVKLIKIYWREI